MITKMTKYDFLVYHAQYDTFLEKLREIGVLHVATLNKGSNAYEVLRDKFALQMRINKQINFCSKLIDKKNISKPKEQKQIAIDEGIKILDEIESKQKDIEITIQTLAANRREKGRMSVWGNFSKDTITNLEKDGLIIGFYNCSTRNYKYEWEERYNAFQIENSNNIVYFITITKDPIAQIEAETFKISELSQQELEEAVVNTEAILEEKRALLKEYAAEHIKDLENLLVELRNEIDIDKVYINTEKAVDDTIMILEGYCPTDSVDNLNKMLISEGVYFDTYEPQEEDNVPIKLRNNAFTKAFEPLTSMYGMPIYQEFDPTPILGPFFLLFFAMCMGDGGYGLLLILFGLGLKYKKIKIEMFDGLGTIITLLGISSAIIGLVLGTAFGIDLYAASWVPEPLKHIMIKGEISGYDVQMLLAIAIGIFHICLALTIKAIGYTKRFGFMKTLSTWGWLLLIVGTLITAILATSKFVSLESAKIAIIAIGAISAIGIYLLNDTKRNVFINIGAGLWDTYNMATGIMGDVLSYIRLYALGLAGGMLGGAFNNLGMMILGDNPSVISWVPFILVVVMGHLLNIAMSSLGAFVHPLRLTFVEYFKNSGYEGKGEKYAPFTKE